MHEADIIMLNLCFYESTFWSGIVAHCSRDAAARLGLHGLNWRFEFAMTNQLQKFWGKCMGETKRKSEGVTWKIALRVWWAQMWRQVALLMITLIPPAIVVLLFMRGNRTASWVLYLALYLLVIPTAIWATQRSLKVNYGSFLLAVNQGEGDEGITWKIALRVWWAQAWRQITVITIVYVLPAILLKDYLVSAWANRITSSLLPIIVGVWAVRQSLRLNYGSFSISVKESS